MGDFDVWRVLISAPSDIEIERACVDYAIRTVNRALEARGDKLRLELRSWRHDVVPGAHAESVQDLIESQLRFDDCEIVIGIFWKKLGSPVPGAPSGSARELRIARDAWKTAGRPHILTYFNQERFSSGSSIAEAQNYVALLEFKEELRNRKILTVDYDGNREFERLLTTDLLSKSLGSSQEVEKASQSLLSCRISASAAEFRAEGFAEYAGDIILRFEFTRPSPEQSIFEIREVDIDIFFNTYVVGLKSGPVPRVFVDNDWKKQTILDGRYVAENGIRFERVPVRYGTLVCVTDILLSAMTLGVALPVQPAAIHASITIREGAKEVSVSGNDAIVGFVRRSTLFSPSQRPALQPRESVIEGKLLGQHVCVSHLEFWPGFSSAFKSRNNEASRLGSGLSKIQFLNRRADSGTRLAAVFSNLPPGVNLYVTAWDEPLDGTSVKPKAMLVINANADGSGGRLYRDSDKAPATTQGGIPLVPLEGPIAVWEWVDEAPYVNPESGPVRFGMIVTVRDRKQLSPTDVLIRGCIAPYYRGSSPYSLAKGTPRRQVAFVPCFADFSSDQPALRIE